MRARVLVVSLALLSGCAGASPAAPRATAAEPSVTTGAVAPAATSAAPTTQRPCGWRSATTYRHVVWIWMENRSYNSVLGPSGGAHRLATYARACGVATDYRAITHPSLPNYLAATSGSTGGVSSDCSPQSCSQRRPSLFGQVSAAGRAWRSYAESMSTNCDRSSHGDYAAKHNPAVYFVPVRAACARWDVRMGATGGGAFAAALSRAALPAFSFVTPNLCDDGHDCSTSAADQWLGAWLDRIVSSRAYRAADTAVFVTWDEGSGSANQVATVVIAPTVPRGTRVGTPLTHYSLLRTTEALLHLPLLGQAATARSMRPGFHL